MTYRRRGWQYGHIGAQSAYHKEHYCCPVCSAAEGAWHRSWCGNVNTLGADNVVRRPDPIDRVPTRMLLTDPAHEDDARRLLEREHLAQRQLFADGPRSLSTIEEHALSRALSMVRPA